MNKMEPPPRPLNVKSLCSRCPPLGFVPKSRPTGRSGSTTYELPWNDRDSAVVARSWMGQAGLHAGHAGTGGLNHIEDLAVGTLDGVYNERIVAVLEGWRLIDAAVSCRPYIAAADVLVEDVGPPRVGICVRHDATSR